MRARPKRPDVRDTCVPSGVELRSTDPFSSAARLCGVPSHRKGDTMVDLKPTERHEKMESHLSPLPNVYHLPRLAHPHPNPAQRRCTRRALPLLCIICPQHFRLQTLHNKDSGDHSNRVDGTPADARNEKQRLPKATQEDRGTLKVKPRME